MSEDAPPFAAARLHPVADGLGARDAVTVIAAPGQGPGFWAGGPSAIYRDGAVWLAYRLRRPVDAGRGYANVVARSSDGYSFETVAEVTSAQFASASLERPAIAVGPDGRWMLYVSCSTLGSKHWWIEALDAAEPSLFGSGRGRMALAGDERTAWKDPVVNHGPRGWEMWACRHETVPADEADRMESWYLTSVDGWTWSLDGLALAGTPGTWDGRGARITAVVANGLSPRSSGGDDFVAFYDGRASAQENWEEHTGVASGTSPSSFIASPEGPLGPEPAIRYLSPVQLPGGGWMVYYEATCTDGTHDLRVEYVPPPTSERQSA